MREVSPCLRCTRVKDPENCENKCCVPWRKWFTACWDQFRAGARQQMDQVEMVPAGVNIGGNYYTAPDQTREYIQKDPCVECLCPKELCTAPCRLRRAWDAVKGAQSE